MNVKRIVVTAVTLAALAGGWLAWRLTPTSLAREGSRNEADPVRVFAAGWDSMLGTFDHDGNVDYSGWSARREELGRLLGGLEEIPQKAVGAGSAALAFWVDVYNAHVVYEVLGGQSAATSGGRARLFFLTRFRVAGQTWSLDSLEKMTRQTFRDPRVHFALNCASRSCPALRRGAYLLAADHLPKVLDEQAAAFLRDPSKNHFDAERGEATLSQIFEWYGKDFEATGTTLQGYLARYRSEPPLGDRLREGRMRVEFAPYDWSLNGKR